jgi:hypothetical protein
VLATAEDAAASADTAVATEGEAAVGRAVAAMGLAVETVAAGETQAWRTQQKVSRAVLSEALSQLATSLRATEAPVAREQWTAQRALRVVLSSES